MHMTKAEGRTIELAVENLTYIHTNEEEDEDEENDEVAFEDMDEVARNLFTFRLDHDYTPLTSPKHSPKREPKPIDELAETLSLLDGGDESVTLPPHKLVVKSAAKIPMVKKSMSSRSEQQQKQQQHINQKAMKTTEAKPQQKSRLIKTKTKELGEMDYDDDDNDDDEEDEDFEEDTEENDDNDSDFEVEQSKQRVPKRSQRIRATKPLSELKKHAKPVKSSAPLKTKTLIKQVAEDKPSEKVQSGEIPSTPVDKQGEKKQLKKEKKTPKPIPDDFALFSTPDIIRRVGGKEQTTPPTSDYPAKQPAKISPEGRSKSSGDQRSSVNQKQPATRLSVDSKSSHEKTKAPATYSVRRISTDKGKVTTKTVSDVKASTEVHKDFVDATQTQNLNETSTDSAMDIAPSSIEASADALSQNTKTYSNLPDVNMDQSNINLEAAGLELDQSILDNINSDMISDDILYQVAKQLVDNTDLQNAIDKSLAEGNLVLDPALISEAQDVMPQNTQQNNQVSTI